ncbi:hypothetical protein TSOC_007613 [Tetrabaena socialis]|uniref:Peptidase M3A/M3B catalytic domain-containing protein n=1 Tax=Tetrabaena socialis TaxID=47790 RepID=A0A2J8A0N2_9CHLO|nr:hypothetical protein TSOC_007613 [Tetrabaena socialis]|eukprot:PNH06082.1 hypothetical protein TSOC_007613 [Tetrabaena socialis]
MAVAKPEANVQELIDKLNAAYEAVHVSYEDNFWATKMDLKGNSSDALASTKTAYENFLGKCRVSYARTPWSNLLDMNTPGGTYGSCRHFLAWALPGDPANLATVRAALAAAKEDGSSLSPEQRHVLGIMERTFGCYILEDPKSRNTMALGYTDPATSEFVKASSVQLRNSLRVSDDEATRKACYEGMRSIGPFVASQFLEIVKERNKLARLLGFEDFYDYKLREEEADYREAVAAGPAIRPGQDAELGMTVRLVHGDEVIADSGVDGGLAAACAKFKAWVDATFLAGAAEGAKTA